MKGDSSQANPQKCIQTPNFTDGLTRIFSGNSLPPHRFSAASFRFAFPSEFLLRRTAAASSERPASEIARKSLFIHSVFILADSLPSSSEISPSSCFRRVKRTISFGNRAQIFIHTLVFQPCRSPSRFLLNFSLVALPPRRWRSARFCSSTFPTAAASERSSSGNRARKSLCTVVLPTANFAAHARTVAPVFSTYSAAARTRLSTSRFMAIPLFSHSRRKRARF